MASPRAFHYWKHEAAQQCLSPEPFLLSSANNAATTAQSGQALEPPAANDSECLHCSGVFAYHRIMRSSAETTDDVSAFTKLFSLHYHGVAVPASEERYGAAHL